MTESVSTIKLADILKQGVKLTPMMEQYWEIKQKHPNILLLFRMGDFYEVFFEDAINASRILNISLTHRGKLGEHPIPMAGIPHHAASTYIDRITSVGQKVAICEQIEDPKEAKGIVKRAVTQIVSPGIPYDLDKSNEREHRYIACAFKTSERIYLVLLDFTNGEFFGTHLQNEEELLERLFIYKPKEFLTYFEQWKENSELHQYIKNGPMLITNLSQDYFNEKHCSIYLENLIPAYKRDQVLNLFPGLLNPVGALAYYIASTQSLGELSHIRPFQMISSEDNLKVTFATLSGLGIFPKNDGQYKESILGHMDATKTSMGARLLKHYFEIPLREPTQIEMRYDAIAALMENIEKLQNIREELSHVRDIERIMAKVSTKKVTASDLLNLARAYARFETIGKELKKRVQKLLPDFSSNDLKILTQLSTTIIQTITDEIGASLEKGNLIKTGANKERDRLAKLSSHTLDVLNEMEQKYRQESGINNLKIKSNNVAGYFIEVSKSHINKVPKTFMRRQTLVNSERYQTKELEDFEKEIFSAQIKLQKLEKQIFDDIANEIKANAEIILKLARSLATIDVIQSLAFKAIQEKFVRPTIHANKQILKIKQSFHPLIKTNIADQFVHHDLYLDQKKYFALITGPNMAGKTTAMREMAIIQFLAQVGSFVPAEAAELGICDYLFSRLGAHDEIIRGQSTFMVEMSETAEILRHATKRSLVILDEIGRGTSTYDGLSIAWALVEYFVKETKAITLFSTHYHELIELVNSLENAKNLTVKVENNNGNIKFLYELIESYAEQSFGIHVAKLAGIPESILKRSNEILHELENSSDAKTAHPKNVCEQLDMFTAISEIPLEYVEARELVDELKKLDLSSVTPLQLMQKIDQIKSQYNIH